MGIFSRKKKRELYRLTGERTRMLTERSSFSFANLTRYIAYTASAGCWGETFAHNKHVVHSSIFLLHVLIDHLTSKRVWRWRGWSRHQPVHVITSINSSYFSDEDSKENTLARLVKCKLIENFEMYQLALSALQCVHVFVNYGGTFLYHRHRSGCLRRNKFLRNIVSGLFLTFPPRPKPTKR